MKEKNIYISYSARYSRTTQKQIKILEKIVIDTILKDAEFAKKLLTEHQAKTNKVKVAKIVKLLILNLIRAIHNNAELIISMDNNTLREHGINYRLFSGIIDKLYNMDYIEIRKGYFHSADNSGKRTRITAKNILKDMIIRVTTEYTEQVTATLADVVEHGEKVKLIFTDDDNNKYAKFTSVEDPIFYNLIDNKRVKLLIDNNKRIKAIKTL